MVAYESPHIDYFGLAAAGSSASLLQILEGTTNSRTLVIGKMLEII
jgi:hypothetical protein